MARFFRIVAVLVILAGCYSLYAEFSAFKSGIINFFSYLADFVFSVVLAGFMWIVANRAARAKSATDHDVESK